MDAHANAQLAQYLARIGRQGGLAKSPAKAAAAKLNGRKGGRPVTKGKNDTHGKENAQ